MTIIYFAFALGSYAMNTYPVMPWEDDEVNLLVSFFYLKRYHRLLEDHPHIRPSKLMLDSGAFSAYTSGAEIDIESLINEAKFGGRWDECVSLDVIKNPELSKANAYLMKERGVHAMPVFHIGEPYDLLREYRDNFDKVGLSCRFGESIAESKKWVGKCFEVAWPCKFHLFGSLSQKLLREFPFHSADATNWSNPDKFGAWKGFGSNGRSVAAGRPKSEEVTLLSEVHYYLRFQRELRTRWGRELLKTEDRL